MITGQNYFVIIQVRQNINVYLYAYVSLNNYTQQPKRMLRKIGPFCKITELSGAKNKYEHVTLMITWSENKWLTLMFYIFRTFSSRMIQGVRMTSAK